MTEEEAKTKWCPMARERDGAMFPCIGSACMAWRWIGVLSDGKRHYSDEALFAARNQHLTPSAGGMNSGDFPLGYCGLAGRP